MGVRGRALATGLGVPGTLLLVPGTALACSCGERDVAQAVDDGHAVAVVTRTDAGSAPDGDVDEPATFRVEASIGPELPDQLSAVLYSCVADYLLPGDVGAVVFQKRGTVTTQQLRHNYLPLHGDPDEWLLVSCSTAELGSALRRVEGRPALPGEGPPVALAWGHYDRTVWLASLDRRGRLLALTERAGAIGAVGVCPGGEAVAVAGQTRQADGLWVHDVPALTTRWASSIRQEDPIRPHAVRCADPAGRDVDVLARCRSGQCKSPTWLVRVRHGQVSASPLPEIDQAVAVADGFVAVGPYRADGTTRSRVVRIAPDGTRTVLGRFGVPPDLAASPDGRTVAVTDYEKGALVTLDGRSGSRLATWVPEAVRVRPIGWTERGLLAVTYRHTDPQDALELLAFDERLRPVARVAGLPRGWNTLAGDAVVTFSRGRLTATPPSGRPLVADELLLARASGVAGLPGRAFAPGDGGARTARAPIRIVLGEPGSSAPGAAVVVLGALAAAAAVRIVWRARPGRSASAEAAETNADVVRPDRVRIRAVVAALGVAASVVLLPVPAQACGCGNRDIEEALDAGYPVAVVTRTDPGSRSTGMVDETATFRLEASVGPALPDRLSGVLDWCQDPLLPGGVGALVFQPRRSVVAHQFVKIDPGPGNPDDWVLAGCSRADLSSALLRIKGAPETSGDGPPVALAWGHHGNARGWLTALDAHGRLLSWVDRSGGVAQVAVCPGGEVAAAAGTAYDFGRSANELWVHELPTLRTRRAVGLTTGDDGMLIRAVRCADPAGRAVDVLAEDRLVSVRAGQVTTTRSAEIDQAVAVADGFVALEREVQEPDGRFRRPVVRIGPDGTRKPLARTAASSVIASPDGRWLALSGHGRIDLLDGRTGRGLAWWVAPGHGEDAAAVGWTPRGLLAVTSRSDAVTARPSMVVLDPALRPVARRPGLPLGWVATAGESLVTFRSGRLTVTPASGPAVEAEELVLAGAWGVVGLPGIAFAPGSPGVRLPGPPVRVLQDQPSAAPGAGVLALGALAAAAAVRIVWRARPRRFRGSG